MITFLLFTSLVIFLILGVPIAISIGLAALIGFLYEGVNLLAYAQKMISSVDVFTLLAIPFFMLAGSLMQSGGMAARLIRFANSLVSFLPGGLAHVQIMGSMFFAALSGSSPATTAAIGKVLIPEMVEKGYPKEFSAAVQAVSGTIGVIIPPSIPMVIFGVISGQSIGKLFAAGFIPGILIGLGLMSVVFFICRKHNYGFVGTFSLSEVWISFKYSIWALLVPIIILGGIYSGIFTPTEAGAVACFYGLFVGIFIYKEIKLNNLFQIFAECAANFCFVALILVTSISFSWIMTYSGAAAQIGRWFESICGDSPGTFLLLFVFLSIFLGCFMETLSIIFIVTPMLFPVAAKLGIDPIHFGIIMVASLALGMATPPVGENLYIASMIAKVKFEKILIHVMPLIAVYIFVILIIAYFPKISLFLPGLLYK